jgi:3-deoxy-manno-octulosonate cytidylyltransferase (CMP-KDO synthetase)
LAEACKHLCIPENTIVVNVQGDEPLIPPDLICSVASLLHQQQDCVMATAAHPILSSEDFYNPNVVKVVVDQKNHALYFSRAPIPWWRDRPHNSLLGGVSSPSILPDVNRPLRHIGIYAYRSSFLQNFPHLQPSSLEQIESLEQLRVLWHGHKIAVHITNEPPPGGVDTPEDLARVRILVENEIQKL